MKIVEDLLQKWCRDAEQLREYMDEARATTLDICRAQLEQTVRDMKADLVTPSVAAEMCGCHPDTLKRRVRRGTLTNYGSDVRPRYSRRELVSLRDFRAAKAKMQVAKDTRTGDRTSEVLRDMLASTTWGQ